MNPEDQTNLLANAKKFLRHLSVIVLFLAVPCLVAQSASPILALGSSAPDFALTGVDGKVHRLADYSTSKLLMVAFLSNHCTDSQLVESRIQKLADDYGQKGVAVIAIQSTNPQSLPLNELAYTDVGETLPDMKVRAAYRHLTFPYLYDGDTQKVARLYGPKVAPHIFLFDSDRKLRYEGHVDDNPNEALIKSSNARSAIDALLEGKPVAIPRSFAAGCPIHLAKKPTDIQAETAKLEAEPVTLALVDAKGLTSLRNNPTGKLLLVNFFATWCGPCVSEFPDLMATNRMYRDRNFALTTVSSNEPAEQPDVLKFLQKMHASTTDNLLFATTDTYALQAAFDPAMGAGVPFTVLIAPNGDIVFQQQGDLDIMELRRAILANLPDDSTHQGSQKYWASK